MTGCPVIHVDADKDGRPDPGGSIDYCKETGFTPPTEEKEFADKEAPQTEEATEEDSVDVENDSAFDFSEEEEGQPAGEEPEENADEVGELE